jgi:hypothetical protein
MDQIGRWSSQDRKDSCDVDVGLLQACCTMARDGHDSTCCYSIAQFYEIALEFGKISGKVLGQERGPRAVLRTALIN